MKFPLPKNYEASFPVYPEGRGLYYEVYVFKTQPELYKYLQLLDKYYEGRSTIKKFSKKTGGAAIYNAPKGNRKKLGIIVLALQTLGAGLVSHEMTHAATYYLYDRGLLESICVSSDFKIGNKKTKIRIIDNKLDELLASAQGNMVSKFWIEFSKRFKLQTISN